MDFLIFGFSLYNRPRTQTNFFMALYQHRLVLLNSVSCFVVEQANKCCSTRSRLNVHVLSWTPCCCCRSVQSQQHCPQITLSKVGSTGVKSPWLVLQSMLRNTKLVPLVQFVGHERLSNSAAKQRTKPFCSFEITMDEGCDGFHQYRRCGVEELKEVHRKRSSAVLRDQ